ncbi:hypothetical protein FOZ63_018028 [Perkinsus olseni]|uniref:CUB domain-containing protein n=1 Tax=Perkinsus olseni TaxID=32597 RepID=A0A7J6QYQ0_PEROL|nr:hypothetical protein FOZ62_030038 [Perkinsus olseni]KAF4718497.1 hypothetical protein FOZ63_018028 [Perkinsus olseni]
MHLPLAGLYLIFFASQRHSESLAGQPPVLLGPGRGSLAGKTYYFYYSSTGEPDIERFEFSCEKVLIKSIQGHLPRGDYECGYELVQHKGAARYAIKLSDECREIVEDSIGYFDDYFLSGCNVESNDEFLYVPTAPTGYDVYRTL